MIWPLLRRASVLLYALGAGATIAGTLGGAAMYRQRIAPPPDVPQPMLWAAAREGRPDSGSGLVLGRLPASFQGELPGADSTIVWHLDLLPTGRYQLRRAYVDKSEPNRYDDIGRWTWDPVQHWLVLSGGREAPVFLEPAAGGALRKLDLKGRRIESSQNDLLQRQKAYAPIEPRLALTGMFTYLADAPMIDLCVDGQRLPVAMEADYLALETAYAAARPAPGLPLLATLEVLIASRPSAEASQPPRPTLVVERFLGVWPRETCGQPEAASSLRNTYWKLVRLDGRPVEFHAGPGQREPHLIFGAQDTRVVGSGGCNRIRGSFELEGDRIKLSRMAGMTRACVSGMDQEQRLAHALKQVEHWRIQGSHLELLGADGVALMRFEAVALRQ